MRQTPAHAISGRPTLTCKPADPVLLLAGLILSGLVQADDLSECMASRMLQVQDNTTIAELRLACQKALSENLFVPEEKAPEVVSERIRQDRLQAHAVEAAEQCGGTFVPPVAAPQKLSTALDAWPAERRIMFADEALAGGSSGPSPLFAAGADEAPMGRRGGPWAILIGPEGGFSSAERARLHKMPEAHPVALGPRILRADTAAVAALTLWQSALGDW